MLAGASRLCALGLAPGLVPMYIGRLPTAVPQAVRTPDAKWGVRSEGGAGRSGRRMGVKMAKESASFGRAYVVN